MNLRLNLQALAASTPPLPILQTLMSCMSPASNALGSRFLKDGHRVRWVVDDSCFLNLTVWIQRLFFQFPYRTSSSAVGTASG